jgi:hypothetical protein
MPVDLLVKVVVAISNESGDSLGGNGIVLNHNITVTVLFDQCLSGE